MVQLFS